MAKTKKSKKESSDSDDSTSSSSTSSESNSSSSTSSDDENKSDSKKKSSSSSSSSSTTSSSSSSSSSSSDSNDEPKIPKRRRIDNDTETTDTKPIVKQEQCDDGDNGNNGDHGNHGDNGQQRQNRYQGSGSQNQSKWDSPSGQQESSSRQNERRSKYEGRLSGGCDRNPFRRTDNQRNDHRQRHDDTKNNHLSNDRNASRNSREGKQRSPDRRQRDNRRGDLGDRRNNDQGDRRQRQDDRVKSDNDIANQRARSEDRKVNIKREPRERSWDRGKRLGRSPRHRSRSPRSNFPRQNYGNTKDYEWGGRKSPKKENSEPPAEKEKPNFGLSGKLTEDTNTVNGIVIKYSEPQEARKPKRRWRLYPFKGEKAMPTLYIHRQSCFLVGRDRQVCDLPVDHPSCSKQHAAIQYRLVPFERENGTTGKRVRPYLIDLESANGTFLNNKKILSKKYIELIEKDVVKFGFSSREYVLLHENSKEDQMDDDVLCDDPINSSDQVKQEPPTN